ncbi:fibronectin type III domain-containing protein [archaeon]|nr:MAG: fibronectin type III domain-containing protein [archaeon]
MGRVPGARVPGKPFEVHVVPSAVYCAAVTVQFTAPVIPAHGLYCNGGGTVDRRAPQPCPAGMGFSNQADGGLRVTGYELQYATFPDFRDARTVVASVVAGTEELPVTVNIGQHMGHPLQPGITYYVRTAARNNLGVGPFCARADGLCDGAQLAALPSAACA